MLENSVANCVQFLRSLLHLGRCVLVDNVALHLDLAPTLVTRPPSPQAHPVASVVLLMRTNLTVEPLKLVRLLARLQDVAGTL